MIQKPSCDQEKYWELVNRGFERFPERKENYLKFKENEKNGFRNPIDYMPIKMDYEVSSVCNFRCKMCLMSEASDRRPPNMKLTDFVNSIDEQFGLIEVKLQGLGEPLLNRDFFKMAEYVVERDIWARTSTNASLLHVDENYKKLIDCGIGEIQVSLDSTSKDCFERIRIGSDFGQILCNVKMLSDYAISKTEEWKISIWMLVQKDNISEMDSMVDLAGELGIRRLVFHMSLNDFGNEQLTKVNRKNTVNMEVSMEKKERLFEKGKRKGVSVSFWDNEGKLKRGDICLWPFSRANITGHMRITPCCLYWENNVMDLGDATVFKKEWDSPGYSLFRESMIKGEIPNICKRCYGLES